MASNAAALSDSAAPQHGGSGAGLSEALLKEAIEQEISAAVDRATRLREVEEVKARRALLQAELSRVQEAMMSCDMGTAAQQLRYSQLEQQCTVLHNALQTLEQQISSRETELQRLLPQPSPVKPGSSARRQQAAAASAEESALLSGGGEADWSYRLFSRIKVGSLELSKRALVFVIHQAVELSVERQEAQRELERLSRELDDERRKSGEERRAVDCRRRELQAMRKCSLTSLQLHYAVQGEDDDAQQQQHPGSQRHTASPIPPSPPRSPLQAGSSSPPLQPSFAFSAALPAVRHTSPPMTNNFISDEQQNVSIEIDHSGSAAAAAARGTPSAQTAAARKGGNVFARLTDASGFTGMYRSIAEEKRQRLPVIAAKKAGVVQAQPGNKRAVEPLSKSAAATPTHSAAQQQQQLQQQQAALAAASAGGQPAKWLTHMDSPLLSWPPPAPLASAHAGFPAYHAADPSAPPRPAGSVFSRLTNPQLYTGAHRARFGLDVQTKHKPGPDGAGGPDFPPLSTGYTAAAVSGAGGSLSAGGPHREAGGLRSRINSPSRSHLRQGSHVEYAATYDSAASASSLPTVADSDARGGQRGGCGAAGSGAERQRERPAVPQ